MKRVDKIWKNKLQTRNHYDSLSDIYESLYGNEQRVKYELALSSVELLEHSKILDIGCGIAKLLGYITETVNQVLYIGIDISVGLLRNAVNKYRFVQNLSYHFICADADYLPFKDSYFTNVFVFTLLQNMPEPQMTLQETKRVADSKSLLVISGLKKFFTREKFCHLLASNELRCSMYSNAKDIKDFIAVCKKSKD